MRLPPDLKAVLIEPVVNTNVRRRNDLRHCGHHRASRCCHCPRVLIVSGLVSKIGPLYPEFLHDRFRWTRAGSGAPWVVARLNP